MSGDGIGQGGGDVFVVGEAPYDGLFAALGEQLGPIAHASLVETDRLTVLEIPVDVSGSAMTPSTEFGAMLDGSADALVIRFDAPIGSDALNEPYASLEVVLPDSAPQLDLVDALRSVPDWNVRLDGTIEASTEAPLVGMTTDLMTGLTIVTVDPDAVIETFTATTPSAVDDPFASVKSLHTAVVEFDQEFDQQFGEITASPYATATFTLPGDGPRAASQEAIDDLIGDGLDLADHGAFVATSDGTTVALPGFQEMIATTTSTTSTIAAASSRRGWLVGGLITGAVALGGGTFLLLSDGDDTPDDDIVIVADDPDVAEDEPDAVAVGTGDEAQSPDAETDEPEFVDPCTLSVLGCIDMGVLPGPALADLVWATSALCASDVTPGSSQAEVALRASPTGPQLSYSGDGPRFLVSIGGGEVDGRGLGGGTITRDGVVTARTTNFELVSVDDDGFTAIVENLQGNADDEGNIIPGEEVCTSGGTVEFSTDAWATWIDLPTAIDPPISLGAFACAVQPTADGAVLYWAVIVDAAVPDPPSAFSAIVDVYGPGSARIDSPVIADSTGDLGPWGMAQPHDGSPMPDVIQDGIGAGAVAGFIAFQPGDPDAEGLDAFSEGDLVDASVFVTNGVFGAFAPSEVCPWVAGTGDSAAASDDVAVAGGAPLPDTSQLEGAEVRFTEDGVVVSFGRPAPPNGFAGLALEGVDAEGTRWSGACSTDTWLDPTRNECSLFDAATMSTCGGRAPIDVISESVIRIPAEFLSTAGQSLLFALPVSGDCVDPGLVEIDLAWVEVAIFGEAQRQTATVAIDDMTAALEALM